jgi:hypothetical protein
MLFGSCIGPSGVAVSFRPGVGVKINHAALETTFVQQFELQADVSGEGWDLTTGTEFRDA